MKKERSPYSIVSIEGCCLAASLLLAGACAGSVDANQIPAASGRGADTDDVASAAAEESEPAAPEVGSSREPASEAGAAATAPKSPREATKSEPKSERKPSAQPSSEASCEELAHEAQGTLTQSCAGCHAAGKAEGGFGVVLDVAAMVAEGKVVPGDRDASKLYLFVSTGLMPRGAPKLAEPVIESLGQWIDCGAPDWNAAEAAESERRFIDINARLYALRDDLDARDDGDERRRTRYIDFSALRNAGVSDADLATYRNAVTFLINSLSFEREVVTPAQVGPDGLVARIDLDDYDWDEGDWERIVDDYPYAVRYETGSDRFDFDEDAARELRDRTGTDIPVVQADWFIAHVSRPPLYYDMLGVDENINELSDALGIDVEDNIEDSRVARAGFNRSGVSVNNRVMERHDKPDGSGAFWLSYDFRANVDEQNIFAHPFDFEQAGGEGIFNLPNGLQGYFLLDGAFNRLDKAPTDIVTDPATRDRAVEGGRSCMGGCHLNRGIILKDDSVRDYVLGTDEAEDLRERTLELYPEASVMQALIASDNQRYLAALEKTGFRSEDDNALNRLINHHEDLLDLTGVAAVVGLSAEDFADALEDNADELPLEIGALRRPGGGLYRDVLDANFDEIVEALDLGEQVQAD